MAVTVTPNLTDISEANTTTDNGTWSGNSGGVDLEVKIQGTGSYTWQASKNSRTDCSFTPTTNIDMSAANSHLYWWASNAVAPFMESKTTGTVNTSGYMLRLTDGSGNFKEWHIAGADTWGGEWKCFILDVNSTIDVYSSSGTLDLTDIDIITWYVDISNSGNIRIIDNQWNDVVRFGSGLTLSGTDFGLVDAAADDELAANKYGVLENIDGIIFCQGQLTLGSTAASAEFDISDEVLIFRDRISTNGQGQIASGFYQLHISGAGTSGHMDGLVTKGAGVTDATRFAFDSSDTNLDYLHMVGTTFIRAADINLGDNQSTTNSTFNDCGRIKPDLTDLQLSVISNHQGMTEGALELYNTGSLDNISGITFIAHPDGYHAIYFEAGVTGEFDFHEFSYQGYASTNGSTGNEVVFNDSGGSVTINVKGGGSPSIRNGTSASTTVNNFVYHDLNGMASGTEVTYVKDSDGSVLYHVEDVGAAGTSSYGYNYVSATSATILLQNVDYIPEQIAISLADSDQALTIGQTEDRVYENP